ncbi:MAG: hypothetical protein V7607_3235 [Solirubrobacteraceae bacterium]
MSDVIAAAIVAGSVGLLGNVATLYATGRQLASHERVERQRIEADSARQRAEHREAERQRRHDIYMQFNLTLADLDRLASGWAPSGTDEDVAAALDRFEKGQAAVMVVATDEIADALGKVVDALDQSGQEMAQAMDLPLAERFRTSYRRHRLPIIQAGADLILAMRADARRAYED